MARVGTPVGFLKMMPAARHVSAASLARRGVVWDRPVELGLDFIHTIRESKQFESDPRGLIEPSAATTAGVGGTGRSRRLDISLP